MSCAVWNVFVARVMWLINRKEMSRVWRICTVERTSDHGLRFRGEVLLASQALQWMGVTSAQGIFTNVMPVALTTIRITSVAWERSAW